MTDEQSDINNDIQAIRCALDALIDYADIITPKDRTRLSRLYIGFGTLLIEMVKDEI